MLFKLKVLSLNYEQTQKKLQSFGIRVLYDLGCTERKLIPNFVLIRQTIPGLDKKAYE